MIPPTFQDIPIIKDNQDLPEKENTRLMRQYIHQGRMLPNTFSGKILLQHPVGHTILSSEVTTAITSKYTDAQGQVSQIWDQ